MTELTTKQIEQAIISNWLGDITQLIIVPHLSFGLLNHEADLAIINKTGYLTEIEIKRSMYDLRKDFEKGVYHCDERVAKFYYCIPLSIKEKAYELFDKHQDQIKRLLGTEIYRRPAVLLYDEAGVVSSEGKPQANGRKLTLEERVTITRLLSIRYWDIKFKLDNIKENG